MIEIVAQNVGKPIYSFGWANWQKAGDDEQQGLALFTKDPHYLSSAMLDARRLLMRLAVARCRYQLHCLPISHRTQSGA